MAFDWATFFVKVVTPAIIGSFIIMNVFIYIDTKVRMFKESSMKVYGYIFFFLFRFFITYSIAYNMGFFPITHIKISTLETDLNLAWAVLAIVWLPEVLAVLEWGLFFSVFALAGLGASLFIDYSYFRGWEILPKIGPVSIVMIVMIILSVRYFSNYSLNEIKHFRRFKPLRLILDISEASFACIGGIILWRYLINTNLYKRKIVPILEKIENFTSAVQVLTIIIVSLIQFPIVPYWLQITIAISAPISFIAIGILVSRHKWYAWKTVFEIYTEEFSSQALTIYQSITKKIQNNKKFIPVIYWALIGNWFTILIAIYDIYSVIYNIIPDIMIVLPLLAILAIKYTLSMINATVVIIKRKQLQTPSHQ
ncbi:MAG: hypothetical protein ACP6IP_07500 [Candidatus Njordarchaeia archaeon]